MAFYNNDTKASSKAIGAPEITGNTAVKFGATENTRFGRGNCMLVPEDSPSWGPGIDKELDYKLRVYPDYAGLGWNIVQKDETFYFEQTEEGKP